MNAPKILQRAPQSPQNSAKEPSDNRHIGPRNHLTRPVHRPPSAPSTLRHRRSAQASAAKKRIQTHFKFEKPRVNDIFHPLQNFPTFASRLRFHHHHHHPYNTSTNTLKPKHQPNLSNHSPNTHKLTKAPQLPKMSRLLRLRTPLLRLPIPSRASSTFSRGPAPPRLPADQQAEFERLQRAASVSSAFQEYANPPASTDAAASTPTSSEAAATPAVAEAQPQEKPVNPTISASEEDTMHPAYVRGAPPEFEGDVNPRTGEVGGPKREPLRWGSGGDWSYNGRVTDF